MAVENGQAPAPEVVDPNLLIIDEVLMPYKKKDGYGYKPIRAYVDLAVEKEPLGRVEIDMLNVGRCSKTVANFLALCAGTRTDSKGEMMHYKGTKVFRMVPKFCMCSGDIVNGDGTNGRSIYSTPTFVDEKSGISHDKPGIVTSLQQGGGTNSNGSQFAILLAPAPWLDRINVPFGLVTSGLDVVERVCEKYGAENGKPSKVVRIFDCGLK